MPRGIAKANAYYNNLEAWNDWRWLADYASQHGHKATAEQLAPPEGSGWRTVDKRIEELKDALGLSEPIYMLRKQ